jgi:hypothetical protein
MFALDPIHPLYNAIISIVAETPDLSVGDLHVKLTLRGEDITLQHLYRTVNRLVEAQILLKSGTTLSVNLMWLSYLEFFAESAKKIATETRQGPSPFPLKEGQHVTFKVSTLADLQTLWNHLLVQAHREAPQKHLLKYYSHAWWQLGKHALDPAFYRRIKESGVRCYWLFGNRTPLDLGAVEAQKDLMDTRLVDEPPFPREGYNLNVYGPYVFECILPDRLSRHLEFIFKTLTDPKQFDAAVYDDIFAIEEPMTLKIRRSESQAKEMRMKIERFFLSTASALQ